MSTDEELVAWVDENENLIRVIPKDLANSDPKYLHLEVVVLIVDKQRRALLQQRAKSKQLFPGRWTVTAAGHVTYGDTLEQTAHRELEEEMGIKIPKLHYLFRERVELEHETHFGHWFLGVYLGDQVIIQKGEVDDFTWVSKSDFDDFVTTHDVSPRTVKILTRFWSGEWDHLLK